jgi:hypothetical protein
METALFALLLTLAFHSISCRRDLLALFAAAPFVSRVRAAERLRLPEFERPRVLKAAQRYLKEPPITIPASHSPRSAGGKHDYFSEGDYWWPDPKDPKGPYIQRDGMTNPDNFTAHRAALMRLSVRSEGL